MNASEILDKEIEGFRLITGLGGQERSRTGTLRLDQNVLQLFQKLEELGAVESRIKQRGAFVGFQEVDVSLLERPEVEVTFTPLNRKDAFFAWTMSEFLSRHDFSCKVPNDFFIADLGYRHGKGDKPLLITHYEQTVALVGLLEYLSDYVPSHKQFVFFGAHKLELDVRYVVEDLRDLAGLDVLAAELRAKDHHQQQRLMIFKNCLVDSLGAVDAEQRFGYVLRHFSEIADRFRRNFQLYARDFTLERQIEEFTKKKMELADKIDGIIGSIETRILAIPLTFVIAAGQLADKPEAVIQNSVVLAGALVFAVFMGVMLNNQFATLRRVRGQVADLKTRYEDKEIYKEIEKPFGELEKRATRQRRALWLVTLIVVAVTLFTCALFVSYTPVATEIVRDFWSSANECLRSE